MPPFSKLTTTPRLFASILVAMLAPGVASAAMPMPEDATSARLTISNVTLYDGRGGAPQTNVDVFVRGGRIARIAAHRAGLKARGPRIDGSGRFLMPGLIDTHIHILGQDPAPRAQHLLDAAAWRAARSELQSYLYFGITTVYDAGNFEDLVYPLREQATKPGSMLPRLLVAGHTLTAPAGYASTIWGLGVPAGPGSEAAIEKHLRASPDMVKFALEAGGVGPLMQMPTLTAEEFALQVALVHAGGLRVTVHSPSEATMRLALAAGVDSFAHLPSSRLTAGFPAELAKASIPISTTLVVFDDLVRLANTPEYLDSAEYRAVLTPKQIAQRKLGGPRRANLGFIAFYAAILPFARENARRLYDAGAVLALGTDRNLGVAVHRELELLAEAGIPVPALIPIATRNAAMHLGRAEDFGTVEPGKRADLLLLDKDPAQSVQHWREIVTVIRDGVVIDRSKLDLPVNSPN
jgi:imidazolonepropionase-like amidohydrolase